MAAGGWNPGGGGWNPGGGGGWESGSEGYDSGAEWDPSGHQSDYEDDPGFAGLGPQDSWQSAPTAMTYELMEGETRKKKFGNEWQFGRVFKQWIPCPKVDGFKCSGTSVNVWVPDDRQYQAVAVTDPIYFRGFQFNPKTKQWIPAQARLLRRPYFFPPYNPQQRPSGNPIVQSRGQQAIHDYNKRIDFGSKGPPGPDDLQGLESTRAHFPEQNMDLQQPQLRTPLFRPTGREVIPGVKEISIRDQQFGSTPFKHLPPKTYHDGHAGYWFKMAFPTYDWNVGSRKGRGQKVTAHADPCMVHVRHVDHPMDRPYYVTPRHTWAMVKDSDGNENKVVLPNRVFRFYPPRMPGQGRGSGHNFNEMKMDDQGYYIAEPNQGPQRSPSRPLTPKEQWHKDNPTIQAGVNDRGELGHWEYVFYRPIIHDLLQQYTWLENGKRWVRLPVAGPRHSITFEPKKVFIPDRPGEPYKWVLVGPSSHFTHRVPVMTKTASGEEYKIEKTVREANLEPFKFKFFPKMLNPNQPFHPSMTEAEKFVAKNNESSRTFLCTKNGSEYSPTSDPPVGKNWQDPKGQAMVLRKQMRPKADSSALRRYATMHAAAQAAGSRAPPAGYSGALFQSSPEEAESDNEDDDSGRDAFGSGPRGATGGRRVGRQVGASSSSGGSPASDPLAPKPGTPAYENYMKLFGGPKKSAPARPAPRPQPAPIAPPQRPPMQRPQFAPPPPRMQQQMDQRFQQQFGGGPRMSAGAPSFVPGGMSAGAPSFVPGGRQPSQPQFPARYGGPPQQFGGHPGFPQQGYPPQGFPPQGFPPQGFPPRGPPPRGFQMPRPHGPGGFQPPPSVANPLPWHLQGQVPHSGSHARPGMQDPRYPGSHPRGPPPRPPPSGWR